MRPGRLLSLCLLSIAAPACASHGAVHISPDESRPHITWEIRTGRDIGDEDLVCGSGRPAVLCVLPASTPERRTMTTVHLFLHAAAQPTSYLGVLTIPFVGGSDSPTEREVSATVAPRNRPYGVTVSGMVTSKPGGYALRARLDATQANSAAMRIAEEIVVVVSDAGFTACARLPVLGSWISDV